MRDWKGCQELQGSSQLNMYKKFTNILPTDRAMPGVPANSLCIAWIPASRHHSKKKIKKKN